MNEKNENSKRMSSSETARIAVALLLEKKALDVRLYEVGEENPITDFYVNATGRSISQIAALADELIFRLEEQGRADCKMEGKRGNTWILVDYGDVIVNIFDKEARNFYNLDRLMPPETEKDISDIISEVDKKFEIKNMEETSDEL